MTSPCNQKEALPRLYPPCSQAGRPKRTKTIPRSIWNTVYFCVEYPDGVYITPHGVPDVSVRVDLPSTEVAVATSVEFPLLHREERLEQLQMRNQNRTHTSHQDYYVDADYVPGQSAEEGEDAESADDEDEDQCATGTGPSLENSGVTQTVEKDSDGSEWEQTEDDESSEDESSAGDESSEDESSEDDESSEGEGDESEGDESESVELAA